MEYRDACESIYPLIAGLIDKQMAVILQPEVGKYFNRRDDHQCLKYFAFVLGAIERHYDSFLSIAATNLQLKDFLIYYDKHAGGGLLYQWKTIIEDSSYTDERSLGYESVKSIEDCTEEENPEDISVTYIINALNI